jgi:hypothetical protein
MLKCVKVSEFFALLTPNSFPGFSVDPLYVHRMKLRLLTISLLVVHGADDQCYCSGPMLFTLRRRTYMYVPDTVCIIFG